MARLDTSHRLRKAMKNIKFLKKRIILAEKALIKAKEKYRLLSIKLKYFENK